MGIFFADVVEHSSPYLCLDISLRLLELYLKEETVLKGVIKVAGEVSRSNENTLKILNLLQDDVLHRVLHLLDSRIDATNSRTLVKDGVCFVEEENRHDIAVLAEMLVACEDCLHVLLCFTDELVTQSCNVYLHDIATSLACNLQHGLCLTCSRGSIEETRKALAHALLFQSALDVREIILREETRQACNLILFTRIVEK